MDITDIPMARICISSRAWCVSITMEAAFCVDTLAGEARQVGA